MADRPDTGAREPQRRIHKLAEYDVPKLVAEVRAGIPAYEVCEPRQCYAPTLTILADLLAEAYAVLAAGVGVPPDADLVANSANYAEIRARAERLTRSIWGEPTRAEQAGLDVLTLLDALAGVGEARPAEPPTENVSRDSALALIADANRWQAAYAKKCDELAGLREQLDAARELLDKHLPYLEHSAYGSDREVASQLRAALGVVAAGESLEANSAKNAEVREGDGS